MVDVVELRVLLAQPLERIPRQLVPAMIVQALHCAQCDEPHGLPRGELGNGDRANGANGVEDEGFRERGVESTEGVWDVHLCEVLMLERRTVLVEAGIGTERDGG